MRNLTIRLDPATHARLETLASQAQRTQSGLLRALIRMAEITPDGGIRFRPLCSTPSAEAVEAQGVCR